MRIITDMSFLDKEMARAEIALFLEDNTYVISSSVARTIRTVQSFLPETAYTSRALASAIFANAFGNTQCQTHEKTKNHSKIDGLRGLPFLIYGVPYAGRYAHSGAQCVDPVPGTMNCGCPINDVLLCFYFWKIWTVESVHPEYAGIQETMGADFLDFRMRTFVCQAFTKLTGMTVDDIYSGEHKSLDEQQQYMLRQQIFQLCHKVGPDVVFGQVRRAERPTHVQPNPHGASGAEPVSRSRSNSTGGYVVYG